ncbi:unnamed protein product [Amoebophrya sp. A25]|nr:unnamed protein product [Amoebophrya sp. A25]|eukprot:GSA25T00016418001.1
MGSGRRVPETEEIHVVELSRNVSEGRSRLRTDINGCTNESTVASTTDTTTSASTGPESSSSTTENPPTEEGGATTSTTPAEVDTTTPAGASTTPAVLLEDEEDDGLILQPAANYAKMERITEEEFIEDMQSHNRTFDEIMAKLQLVETRDSEDLRAEAKKEEAELADEKPRKKGEKAKVGTVKTGKELMESLETVPTVNQMRTKFANIQARAAQFEENSTDTPFGGELDEMVSYSFSSLDHTVVGKGNQNHLLCYAKGVGGVGTCRIVKTFAGRAHNDLVKGNGTEFNVRGIRNLMVKSITKKFFVLCHDSTAAAGCFILEVRESEKQEQSGDMDWPSIVYHNRVGEAFAMGAVSKLLSLIVTRPPVHTELRTTAAEFAVCYKTLGTALGRRKKGSAQYQCDQGTFDDRDPASLKKLLPQEEDTAGGVEQEEGSFSEGDVLEGDVLDVGVVQKEKGRPKEEL